MEVPGLIQNMTYPNGISKHSTRRYFVGTQNAITPNSRNPKRKQILVTWSRITVAGISIYPLVSNIEFDFLLNCTVLYGAHFIRFSTISSFSPFLSRFSRLAALPISNLPLPSL